MINKLEEYDLMEIYEKSHWWYLNLHKKCLKIIKSKSDNKNIKILDIGCGTGGLMSRLKNEGYKNIQGFDISDYAIMKCKNKKLDAWIQDIKTINNKKIKNKYEVIYCCDILCYLTEKEIIEFFQNVSEIMSENALLIINIPAFKKFSGIHDLAVGIKERFKIKEIINLLDKKVYSVDGSNYWPFLLFPVIYLIRLIQRLKLRTGCKIQIKSDIRNINKYLNLILYKFCDFENKYLNKISLIGSSLFIVIKKNN